MRIIAGDWRGRRLHAPGGPGTRPTSSRAREAVFSMLLSELGTFTGLRIADLFAGTGALGLEALSRGAAHVTFVENDRAALAALRRNLADFAAGERAVIRSEALPSLGSLTQPVDLAFLDAPYGQGLTAPAIAALRDRHWLSPHALVCAETGAGEALAADSFETLKTRRYGKAEVHLLRLADKQPVL
ncbi:MAG: 16S rRNA (guanine(966)-N(2))-methyltransferase RsmD [Pacificimonas sp.]|jgi:16S rRNA (guanine966-N2)-methyltransferase|nr:16S rRNA (guanine(966)-N(2))-methyltransferase RsmD [Pacificimonas sp.]